MTDNSAHASPSGELQSEIAGGLASAVESMGFPTDGLDLTLRPIPLDGEWGFGSTLSFQLRKVGATGNPKDIAQQLVDALPHLPQIARVEAVNGYVNFYVDRDWYANRIVGQVLTQREAYGSWPDRGERVMVEYAALNTHKAMHVGHLRNVVLGKSVYNILKSAGFDTVSATYIGDIGMHVMKALWAYRNFYNNQEPAEDRGPWLEKLYVDATARIDYRKNVTNMIADAAREDPAIAAQLLTVLQALADSDPENLPFVEQLSQGLSTKDGPDWKNVLANRDYIVINLWAELGQLLVGQTSTLDASNSDGGSIKSSALADLAADYKKLDTNRSWWDQVPNWQAAIKDMFARWEAREPALVELWQETRQWSLDMFHRIFDDLGVSFDAWFYESEVEEPGKLVVDELIQKGIAEDHRAVGEPVIVRVDDKLRAHPELSKKYEKELWKINKDGTRDPKEAWRVLVVLRSDGTSLYATKDLELAKIKFN
ncbi:MAG: arginine--tRNA ligase, partial [Chloroflexia bacterium]